MSNQVAKLFLRGSLVRTTAKNLTPEQKQQVSDLMNEVWNDRKLDNAKHEFCLALGRTIGGEYTDKEFAMQEVWITLWRTAVDVLFHNKKDRVVEDKLIRKKHFQTCIFNYLRQILTENKIPTTYAEREISGPASIVAYDLIEFILVNNPVNKIDYIGDKNDLSFNLDTNMLSMKVLNKIWSVIDDLKDVTKIIIQDNMIQIIKLDNEKYLTKKIKEKTRVSISSLAGNNDDDGSKDTFQQHCEHQSVRRREKEVDNMMVSDTISVLRERLPETAKKVFDVLVNQPKDFLDTYYPSRNKEVRPKEIHIAQYLNMTKPAVQSAIATIKEQAIALDLG